MSEQYSGAVATAREYYNSEDADQFYYRVWGGEDIHVGLYETDVEPIFDASRRTVAHMADMLGGLDPEHKVLDVGAGYGGAARYLARTFKCPVVALNLSEVENQRDREINEGEQLDHLIEVVDGNFENLPFDDNTFNVVWSQDSFLHSGDRESAIREAARVLKPGGVFIFTDPMQADDCPEGVLQPILDRLHLDTLGSPAFYREQCKALGLEEIGFEEHTHQLARHYGRVLRELRARAPELKGDISDGYIERMQKGLEHWVEGGEKGHLSWGIFRFRKG